MHDSLTGPQFLGIGAPRCGTTWLYRTLLDHPQVWLPPLKELHYFDSIDDTITGLYEVHKRSFRVKRWLGRRAKHYLTLPLYPLSPRLRDLTRLDPRWDINFFFGDGSLDWYLSLFERHAQKGMLTGEITPRYFKLDRQTIELVRHRVPANKLLVLLRNPVEAAWSAINRGVRDKNIRVDPNDPRQLKSMLDRDVIQQVYAYGDNLENWMSVYNRDEVFIGFFEDLVDDPAALLKTVCEFLRVDNTYGQHGVDLTQKVNSAAGTLGGLPPNVRAHLAASFLPQLEKLNHLLPDCVRPREWLETSIMYLK